MEKSCYNIIIRNGEGSKCQIKKTVLMIAASMLLLSGCDGSNNNAVHTEVSQTSATQDKTESNSKGENHMQIKLNKSQYQVMLDSNVTVDEIIKNLPLSLTLSRYAEHEYNTELPFVPPCAEESTSDIKAGHILLGRME